MKRYLALILLFFYFIAIAILMFSLIQTGNLALVGLGLLIVIICTTAFYGLTKGMR